MQEQRRTFHEELDKIRDGIVRLAAMATELIPRGTEVLLGNDLVGAQRLIEDDDAIDDLSVEIEDNCYNVLALQQPMAGDLRSIVTAVRLVSEIERSADLMVNVAKGARRIYPNELPPGLRGLIERMSEEASRLYKLAIDAYVEHNAGLAAALDDMDDHLDQIHTDYIEAIFQAHHDGALEIDVAVQLALVGRYYERIGDHAVNIGNRVEYMVTGWLPEHSGAARHKARTAVNDSAEPWTRPQAPAGRADTGAEGEAPDPEVGSDPEES